MTLIETDFNFLNAVMRSSDGKKMHNVQWSCECMYGCKYILMPDCHFTFIRNLERYYPNDFGIGKKYDDIHKIFPENAFPIYTT